MELADDARFTQRVGESSLVFINRSGVDIETDYITKLGRDFDNFYWSDGKTAAEVELVWCVLFKGITDNGKVAASKMSQKTRSSQQHMPQSFAMANQVVLKAVRPTTKLSLSTLR